MKIDDKWGKFNFMKTKSGLLKKIFLPFVEIGFFEVKNYFISISMSKIWGYDRYIALCLYRLRKTNSNFY